MFTEGLFVLFEPEWLVVVFFFWVMYQIYAPTLAGIDTRLSPLFEVPERLGEVEENTAEMREDVQNLDRQQEDHLQAIRANARALDPEKDLIIRSEEVDDHLLDEEVPITELTGRLTDDRTNPT